LGFGEGGIGNGEVASGAARCSNGEAMHSKAMARPRVVMFCKARAGRSEVEQRLATAGLRSARLCTAKALHCSVGYSKAVARSSEARSRKGNVMSGRVKQRLGGARYGAAKAMAEWCVVK